MLSNPQPGDRVELRYRAALRPLCPHGQKGAIVAAGRGRPRNHLVRLDIGVRVVVPAGNLQKEKPSDG